MPVSIGSSALVSIAAPQKIAQLSGTDNINRPTLNIGSQGERVSELQAALKLLGFYTGAVDGIYKETTAKAVSQFKQAAGLNPDGIVDVSTWQKLFPGEPIVPSITPSAAPNTTTIRPFTVPTQPHNVPKIVNSKPEPRPTKPKPSPTPREQKPSVRSNPTLITPTPFSERTAGIQYTQEGLPILRLGNRGSEVVKLQRQLQRLGLLSGSIDGEFGATTEAAVKSLQTRYGLQADGVAGGATWEILLRRSPQQR